MPNKQNLTTTIRIPSWSYWKQTPLYGLIKYAGTTVCDLNISALKSMDIYGRIEEPKSTPSDSV